MSLSTCDVRLSFSKHSADHHALCKLLNVGVYRAFGIGRVETIQNNNARAQTIGKIFSPSTGLMQTGSVYIIASCEGLYSFLSKEESR